MGGLLILPVERSTDDFVDVHELATTPQTTRANPDSCGSFALWIVVACWVVAIIVLYLHVWFGSLADIEALSPDVRFTSESGHRCARFGFVTGKPACAYSGRRRQRR
jgi:hypothetical protein